MPEPTPSRAPDNDLAVLEKGFCACWQNAQDLITAARHLLGSGLHAPALSLSVQALEELANLFAVDSLLYARSDKEPTTNAARAVQSMNDKLSMVSSFPAFIDALFRSDSRKASDRIFAKTIASNLQYLSTDGNAVLDLLPSGFSDLKTLKQQGLYTASRGSEIQSPREQIDPTLAQLVYKLAWRSTTIIDGLFRTGNLDRYIRTARAVRDGLTEQEHRELKRRADDIRELLFEGANDSQTR